MYFLRAGLLAFLALALVFLAMLYQANPSAVSVAVPYGEQYNTPIWLLMLMFIAAVGIIIVFVGQDAIMFLMDRLKAYREEKEVRARRYSEEAEQLFINGYYNLALERAEQAVELAPEEGRGHLLVGNILRRMGKIDEAIEAHDRGAAKSTDHTHILLAQVQDFEEGNEPRAAERLLRRILGEHKENLAVMAEQRRLWVKEGHYERALEVQQEILRQIKRRKKQEPLQEAIEQGLLVQLGRQHGQEGRYRKGFDLLKRVLRRDKHFTDAYLAFADIQVARHRFDGAFAQLEMAYDLSRSMAVLEHFFELGRLLSPADFEPYRQRFGKEFGDDMVYVLLEARYLLSQERYDEAKLRFEALEGMDLGIPEVYSCLATCLEQERPSPNIRIIRLLKMALECKDTFEAYYECSNCHHRVDRWQASCPNCEAMNSMESNIAKILHRKVVAAQAAS